jgi:hypothetical protein
VLLYHVEIVEQPLACGPDVYLLIGRSIETDMGLVEDLPGCRESVE